MAPKGKVVKQIEAEEKIPDEVVAHIHNHTHPVGPDCCGGSIAGPPGVPGPTCDPGLPGTQGPPGIGPLLRRPLVTSPEWNDYVLSHLTEDEFAEDKNGKKHPTTDGLRRVAEELFGDLLIETNISQSPSIENGMVATADCSIEVRKSGATSRYVREIADATPDNTDFPFSKFLTAIAGTRAEGRALRKFLRLRKVVTAEEIGSTSVDTEKRAVMTQVNVLKKMGEQYDINVWGFINKHLKEKWGNKVFNYINEIPYDFMLDPILSSIQTYQQKDKDGNMMQVSPDLKGYDPNFIQDRWKS